MYRTQGLLNEAMLTYKNVMELINKSIQPENSRQLLEGINNKIELLKKTISKYNDSDKIPELSVDTQNLIKEKFAFSTDKESSILEGAIILTKFGQFERAIKEFNELLKIEPLRLVAAKNILRCYFASSGADDAVSKYKEWIELGIFSTGQEEKIKFFLDNLLKEKGPKKKLPAEEVNENGNKNNSVEKKALDEKKLSDELLLDIPKTDDNEEEFLDISSVGITLGEDQKKGLEVILDVAFQSGDMVSLIVPGREKALIDIFKIGLKFNAINFYSPIAILNGSGVILTFSKIDSGPKAGNYSLDLKMFTD
ncbi:MAG: hypothetical protein KJ826_02175 [Proteobacteria bacterium]|nr:hypothetical protein [Pseudomonadota bacterium]